MKVIRYVLFILSIFCASIAVAQTDSTFLGRANAAIAKQSAVEKVYLHLNKPCYNFADTIWYKAYVVAGQHRQLSALSGVLYVELISPADTLVSRQTMRLDAGTAANAIPLAATLPQGLYRIRAYTKWMRNAGAAYFYNKQIRIGGIAPQVVAAVKPALQKPDIQFFPEGGELVVGLRSRVAFKAINSNGLGQDIKGVIEDNEGNVVADVVTQHSGMGAFALVPQSGKTYRAKINGGGEAVYAVDLPSARATGYTITVNNSHTDTLFIKVQVNDRLLVEKRGSTFYLLAQSAGKIYYIAKSNLTQPVYMAAVDKGRFPSGIVQFTLFDHSDQPVAERIAFIQNADSLKLQLNADAKVYKTRQPVKINLSALAMGRAANGTFSVTVINQDTVAVSDENTIVNTLLLSSDLKGNIEQPNYYFNNTIQASADLDLLMLTQGYRKFEWKQAFNNAQPQTSLYQPENLLELAGKVQTMGNKPVANGKIILSATRENFFADTLADENGNFKFTNLSLSDTAKVTLNAKKANNNSNVKITVLNPGYAEIMKKGSADTVAQLQPQLAAPLQKAYQNYQLKQKNQLFLQGRILKEVRVQANKVRKKIEMQYSKNLNGPGNANSVIMGDEVNRCVNLADCLRGKVLGVAFSREGYAYSNRSHTGEPMAVVVDGAVIDGKVLPELNTSDIYTIEILRSVGYTSIYGADGASGLLVITTRRGGEHNLKDMYFPGVITCSFEGFTATRVFYTPQYSAAAPLPDKRETVYWNPNIITDKDGGAIIEYLNNDTRGTYRVVVEGIDEDGNLGRQVYKYKVE